MSLEAAAVRDARSGSMTRRGARTQSGSRQRLSLVLWLGVAAFYVIAAALPQCSRPATRSP